MTAFSSVIGYPSVKRQLLPLCEQIKHPKPSQKFGVPLPDAILLYGEHGVGKSLMARALAEESGAALLSCAETNSDTFIKNGGRATVLHQRTHAALSRALHRRK